MAEDYSIQAISYMKAPEETEFQKIKRRLSMKVIGLQVMMSTGRELDWTSLNFLAEEA